MKILRLELQHFRIHNRLVIHEIAPAMLFIGPNGSGKSSVLEALHFVSTGVSDRAEKIEELVSFKQELGRIKLSVGNDLQEEAEIEAVITRGSVGGRKTQHRLWSVNDVRRTHTKVAEMVHTVLFRPEDMRLIEGSPGRRRKYLDAVLAQVNPQYRHSLQAYEQFLLRRNKVLQAIREGEQPKSVLHYWTEGILKHGQFLQITRREYVGRVSTYKLPLKFTAVYNPSILSVERLAAYADKEVAAGHTLVGPHKDDIDVDMSSIVGELPNKPSHLSVLTYGSRGKSPSCPAISLYKRVNIHQLVMSNARHKDRMK